MVDVLLELAARSDVATDLVEGMMAMPKENIERFKAKLCSLKRSRHFIGWRESSDFARRLEIFLQDLRASVDDPKCGAELVAAFFETDKGILGNCDDSSGNVSYVYRFDAKELFVSYAQRCPDKEWLTKLVFKLNRRDDYGVRNTLIDCAAKYLPGSNIRKLINTLQKAAEKEKDKYAKRRWLYLIESLARQIKDAQLFEKVRIASWGSLSIAACVDIARVYLESGDPESALSWLEKISPDETYQTYERDQLLYEVFGQLGETDKQEDVAWRIFRQHRTSDSLEVLLSVIGAERRESVIMEETDLILADKTLSMSDTAFLMEMGRVEDAEQYLLDRADHLNGDFYGSLLPLAEAMETKERHLAATVIYRALLDSILRRGQTNTYSHGVRYLKKLDKLAKAVSEWRGLDDHDTYLQQLRQAHGRKYSFWSRYEK